MEQIYSSVYRFVKPERLRPEGWLKRQLEIQAEGLSGHLDEIWPDIRDSAWIGGKAEGWERVPYWLDGFVPLAYLLRDEALIARAKKYVEAIMDAQQADGWLCPCTQEERAAYDVWAVFIICKALMVYGQCSGDHRAAETVYRAMKNLEGHLTHCTLFNWGQSRWFEALIPLQWLYEQRPEPWMIELAVTIASQGLSYERVFACWKDQQPDPRGVWRQQTHIVNLMMALKSEAVFSGLSGQEPGAFARKMYEQLRKYHGTPMGHIQGDECLAGKSPIRGTELCAVVEEMYSCELLASITGEPFWLDLLERLAFNSLPATISADMWSHQYDQQLNQISCSIQQGTPIFGTNGSQSNLFGLEPNYGCCTANFSQGWPKLALSAFLHRGDTVVSAVCLPSELRDGGLHIVLDTDYPFENRLTYTVTTDRAFTLAVRTPSFAERLTVDGEAAAGPLRFSFAPGESRTITVAFDAPPRFESRPHGLSAVRCGSLVCSLPVRYEKRMLEYERDGVSRRFPYCDYEYIPRSDWNYAYCGRLSAAERRAVGDVPFSSEAPPVVLRASVQKIDWGLEDGYETVCAKTPRAVVPLSPPEELELYPYGCAKLRMTELPLLG